MTNLGRFAMFALGSEVESDQRSRVVLRRTLAELSWFGALKIGDLVGAKPYLPLRITLDMPIYHERLPALGAPIRIGGRIDCHWHDCASLALPG